MIVSSCCSHSSWLDVIRHDLTALGERFVADSAFPALFNDLPVEQSAHLRWRTQFAIATWMVRIFARWTQADVRHTLSQKARAFASSETGFATSS